MLRSKNSLISVSLLTLLTLPLSARADFFLHHWENQHEKAQELHLNANVNYYLSGDNFDGDGALLIPAGFESYSRIQTDLTAGYGITDRLSAFARLGWARAQLNHSTLAGSSFGFTDSTLGLNFRVHEFPLTGKPNGVAIDLQLQGDLPLYNNAALQPDGPGLGDGTTDFTGGAFITVPVLSTQSGHLSLTGGGGYTFRSTSYSSAIPWSISAHYTPNDEGFSASFSGLGVQSLLTDPRAATLSLRSTALSNGSGGSFISAAVNPSLITVRGEIGYQFAPNLGVGLNASQTLWGQAAPNAFNIGVALRAHFGSSRQSRNSALLSPKDYGRSNQGFVNYSLEAHVTRTNDRLNLIKIDRGNQEGVAVGQVFDIFVVKKDGTLGEAVARGKVVSIQANESALTIDEYFKEVWIDEGFVAKRPIQP